MIVPCICCFFLFGVLRFYIPILVIVGMLAGHLYLTRYIWRGIALGLTTITILYLFFGNQINMVVTELFTLDPISIIKGLAKQLLSPIPWQVSPESGYQLLGSMLHLVMLPVAFFGIYLMIRTKDNLVIFLGVALVVYAVLSLTPNLWTPRHRIVGDIIWIFFEYYGLYSLVRINQALNSRVRWQT